MSFLNSIIPINLNEEKEKFFIDNTYNPQFKYKNKIDRKKLYQYKKPTKKYLDIAEKIIDKAYFGRNEHDLTMMEGAVVSQKNVENTIHTFLEMHGIKNRFNIVWSSSFIARTTINVDTIKLRLPANFRKEGLLGMLYHEIGTHALRRINYEQQPWFKKKNKYGFNDYLKTEEGLATLHTLIPHTYKSAFSSALRYKVVSIAQENSFVETWNKLNKYAQDTEKRWLLTFRQKRGLEDTSKPGGYSKDLVYFEGLVDVYRWLEKNNYDITSLYFGKSALSDAEKSLEMNPEFVPELPSFFSLNKEKYKQEIKKIGEYNELNTL
jgi:hypothetical protein